MTRSGFVALCLAVFISLPYVRMDAHEARYAGAAAETAKEDFRHAVMLFDRGMYDRAMVIFDALAEKNDDYQAEGYSVLCQILLQTGDCGHRVREYAGRYPYSWLLPQIRYRYALGLFDKDDYEGAAAEFAMISRARLHRDQADEFLFKRAYCDFSLGDYDRAYLRFKDIDGRPLSDYTAPARYAAGYICYSRKNFGEALEWFSKSVTDSRFSAMSSYYLMECRFMLGDHRAVCDMGPEMLDKVPQERRPHLVRMISESWLVLGDAEKARYWFDQNKETSELRTRNDYFYAGSVLYAVDDYQGAIDKYSMMTDRTDSIGQIANYQMGYCYIQTKNKVAAMDAFRDAAMADYSAAIAEDAYFNYAKLAFDLNSDTSVFNDYLRKYGDVDRGDRINNYIAVAALYGRDYETAIDAYGKIDEMDSKMTVNYMKANYLRASQLIADGSYRDAVPYLKAAAYYSDKMSMFNQLSRYWIAESYYRNDQYDKAIELYTELYNISALYKMTEGNLIPFNIAYCYFMEGDYSSASRWFREYLDAGDAEYAKEAALRYADCLFMLSDYAGAAGAYDTVIEKYFDVNDIYPYYRAAVSYGLEGDNARKISLLENTGKASPSADFYSEALFELGRSYVAAEDAAKASAVFNRLIGTTSDSTYMARSMIELGMLSRNAEDTDKALEYFKKVVEEFPRSGYADDALLAVESVYQSMNEPEKYLAYIDRIGKSSVKTEVEKEIMIFNAAEQIYLSGNYQRALASLQSYMDKYPMGARYSQAEFYLAESYRQTGQPEKACGHYGNVAKDGDGSFKEIAMLEFSRLSYDLQRYEDALSGYTSLRKSALLDDNRHEALAGMMRSAFRARKFTDALELASEVKADGSYGADTVREADWISAKSYLATSRREEAFRIFGELARDPMSAEGAEAAWMIIQDCYDRGEFSDVENKVYSFSDSGTGQTYWLAKAFIVLGDAFVERGDYSQAMATFQSISDGYSPLPGGDDILDNVKMRIYRLEELIKLKEAADSAAV